MCPNFHCSFKGTQAPATLPQLRPSHRQKMPVKEIFVEVKFAESKTSGRSIMSNKLWRLSLINSQLSHLDINL